MSLESDYELLEILRDDGVQSFRGREISTGRSLEVHLFLPFGRPENKVLFERLKGLPLESRRRFLDVGTDGSTPYIVTDPLPQIRGFKEWAETLFTPAKSAASVAPPEKAPLRASEMDESVQILQAGQWRTGTPLPESLIIPPKPAAPLPSPEQPHDLTMVFQMPFQPPTENNAGEFTGLFQSPAQPAAPPPPALPKTDPEPEVGEFTKLFKNPLPPPPLSPPPQEKASNVGEFTRMFENSAPPAAANPVPPADRSEFTDFFQSPLQPPPLAKAFPDYGAETPLPRTVAPPPTHRGSEFTQVFGESAYTPERPSPSASPSVPPPPLQTPGSRGASDYGSAPQSASSATGAFSGGLPLASAPPPRPSSGPSEYTRMMSAPATPTLGQPQPPPPPPAIPAPAPVIAPKSNAALFIALGILALLALLVVVYFFLSHR